MDDFTRFVGSSVIAIILVSIPALLVASIAYEWGGFWKSLLCAATDAECVLIMHLIYKRSEDERTD